VAESPAAVAAFAESTSWADLAERWRPDGHPAIWDDLPPIERLVIPEVDPGADLARRAQRWGYPMDRGDLSDIALFAAALAQAEGEAWTFADRSVATMAYDDRRFLVSDRLLPWAVPWLRAAARCFPESRRDAEASSRALLDLGERHRPAPHLAGSEGLVPPGHDGFGPLGEEQSLEDRVGSLWGGMVVFDRSIQSLTGRPLARRRATIDRNPETVGAIATWYEVAAVRWDRLAAGYPGTARFWMDLSQRSLATIGAAA
jgi:hypothetical protein